MKPELRIRVDTYLDGDEHPDSIYAELSGPGIDGARRIMLPSGTQGWSVQEVDGGEYLIQAWLPSGEVLSEDVTVPPDATVPQDCVLGVEQSAHEYLAWAKHLGSVDTNLGAGAHLLRVGPPGIVAGSSDFFDAQVELWSQSLDQPSVTQTLDVSQSADLFVGQGDGDQAYHVWTDVDEENLVVRFMPSSAGPGVTTHQGQLFLRIGDVLGGPFNAALPLPWLDQSGEPVRVEAMLHRPLDAGDDEPPRLVIVLRDPIVGVMLGYLQNGQLPAVREMRDVFLDQAENLLYQKRRNPYAAAAGALILLRTRDYERLHNWPRNLSNWFPWLPDGAVIYGWCCLAGIHKGDDDEPDLKEARRALLEAADRGLPVFTSALQLLIGGLERFELHARWADKTDEAVTKALRRLRPWAVDVDWDQPLTVRAELREREDTGDRASELEGEPVLDPAGLFQAVFGDADRRERVVELASES